VLAALVAAAGCADASAGTPRVPDSADAPARLTSVVLGKGAAAQVSSHLLVLDGSLVATGRSSVYVLDAASGATLSTYAREESGLGQLREGTSLQPAAGRPDRFWVFDGTLKRVTEFALAADRKTPPAATRAVDIQAPTTLLRSLWINDSTLVSTGIFTQGRFSAFARDGRPLRALGDAPADPRRPGSPVEVRQHAYDGPITAPPSRSRIAVATRQADRLGIYHPGGGLIREVRGSSGFDPEYEVRRLKGVPYMTSGDDLRFGYIDLASTEKYIFALYSGRTRAEAPGEANYGEYVQVFDWSGTLIESFRLDAPAIAIAADASNRHLYAIRRRPDSALVRYDLRFRAAEGRAR
jgi:hypothetical protein